MKETPPSGIQDNTESTAETILQNEDNKFFKDWIRDAYGILDYGRRLYARGVVELYPRTSEYRGHVSETESAFWKNYGPRHLGYVSLLRQLELQQQGKIDEFIKGRNEDNYNEDEDHFIVYETRTNKQTNVVDNLHADNAEALFLYESGTRPEKKARDQMSELLESMQLPEGSITERFYLKNSRACPLDVFIEACKDAGETDRLLAQVDAQPEDVLMRLIQSRSYTALTAAADHLDKSKYDYVLLPGRRLIVLNPEALVSLKDTEKELIENEETQVKKMYTQYLIEDSASEIERGSQEDRERFCNYMQKQF